MNNTIKIVAVVVILVIVAFGGYKLYHHFTKAPAMTPVAAVPTKATEMSPTTTQNDVYKMMSDAKGVSYLADLKGMTLYTYSKDTKGVSICTGTCIAHWPAYGPTTMPTASALPANVTVITRSDKSLQYAWNGMPLYYFVSDTKAGDVTGDGVGGFVLAK